MTPDRIAELLAPFLPYRDQLTIGDLDRISTYINILLRWNARINLTAIRDPEQIVTRHFGESLFAATHLFSGRWSGSSARKDVDTAPTLADVGSGAGFPGIPIKLWVPDIHVTLVESNHKKAAFLKEIARALILTNINIQSSRAESLETRFDVVTLRAVERFGTVLPTATSLVAPGGRLALLIGSSQLPTACSHLSSLELSDPIPIPRSTARILLIAQAPSIRAHEVTKVE